MKRLLVILFLLSAALPLAAQKRQNRQQQPTDSLVRLMSAQSAELIQENNRNYRKVIGPARFLHNKTYLICDTAYWDVDVHFIQAFGHVRILQDETVLTSEKLDFRTKTATRCAPGTSITTPKTPSPSSSTAGRCGTRTAS